MALCSTRKSKNRPSSIHIVITLNVFRGECFYLPYFFIYFSSRTHEGIVLSSLQDNKIQRWMKSNNLQNLPIKQIANAFPLPTWYSPQQYNSIQFSLIHVCFYYSPSSLNSYTPGSVLPKEQHSIAVIEEAFQVWHSAKGNFSLCWCTTHLNKKSVNQNLYVLKTKTNLLGKL